MKNIFQLINGKSVIIDVEAVGLHGEGYAVSMLLTDWLLEKEHVTFACEPDVAMGTVDDYTWVKENVTYPEDTIWFPNQRDVRAAFWEKWLSLRQKGYLMCADVAWPVESSFLSACVKDDRRGRKFQGPYPLVDLSTLFMLGDLSKDQERLPEHMPEHNPLADCRHSLRQAREVIRQLAVGGRLQ